VGEGKEKKRKEKEKFINNKILIYYWSKIRSVLNGVQKLQKIENISLRRNMKTV